MWQVALWSFRVDEEIKGLKLSGEVESGLNIGLRTYKAHTSDSHGLGGKCVGVLLPLLNSVSCQMLLVSQDTFCSCVLTQPRNPS